MNGSENTWTEPFATRTLGFAVRIPACCLLTCVALLVSMAPAAESPRVEAPPPSAESSPASQVELRLKIGDDPRWAAPEWDDRDWKKVSNGEFPARAGVYWVRVRLARGSVDLRPLGRYSYTWPVDQPIDALFLATAFSFDLYWDGQLLARSGVVGSSRATEVPGPLDHLVRIPDELLGPGGHLLAMRISSYHYNFPATQFGGGVALTQFTSRLVYETRQPIVPLMLLAGALLMAAISLVMFLFAERRRSLLLCNLLSLALALFYGLIALRWLYNATYDWHAPRLAAIATTTGVISVLLPWLLAEQFTVMRRGQWIAALAPLLVAAWFSSSWYELKALWMCRAMLLVSLGIVGWAAWHRRPGARWVFIVLGSGFFVMQTSSRSFLDPFFFLFLEGLVLFVFATIGMQVRAERQRARELVLMAARLETELLKRNIQPHFLLNTLATIIEMIEQTPKDAVALIEALAIEFRILARVSGDKLIPLMREIELCHAHLQIMSLRKGATCSLATHGLDESAAVPPALFHTLVENGLTHLMPRNGEQKFELHATRESAFTRYVMTAYGEAHESSRQAREGTGTRYIKARLEESYPGCWSLSSEPIAGGWRTVIEIKGTAAADAHVVPAGTPAPASLEKNPA